MNIMYIHPYAGSPLHGMQLRPYYLAKEWSRQGHPVTIAAASFSHIRQQQPNAEGVLGQEHIMGIRYLWVKTPAYDGNGVQRVANMMSFSWRLLRQAKKLADSYKPDVVIVSSPHPFAIFAGKRIARRAGAKLVFEVRDLWPLTLIELGNKSPRHPFIRFMQYAEDYAYREADRIVSLLPLADQYMVEHGMDSRKFTYMPNGIDVEEWQEVFADGIALEQRSVIERARNSGKFLVGYAGAHGMANALGDLVETAALLRDQPVSFFLVGQGPEKEALQRQVETRGLQNVTFFPPVSKTAIPDFLSQMDALYIGWKKRDLYKFGVSANKLFDYLMAGKPVIHAIEAGNDPVRASGCGISVPPENPEWAAGAILQLLAMSEEERQEMGRSGQKYVLAEHDYKQLAHRFLRELAQ